MIGFACPFTKHPWPMNCTQYTNTLMALEVLYSSCGCLTNVYPTPSLVRGILVVSVGLLHLHEAAVVGLNQSG